MILATDPILLDCDGVCADMVPAALDQVGYRGPQPQTWDFKLDLNDGQRAAMERLLNNRDFWASIPPIPGAIPGVEYLRSLNFNIQWVTSPWYSCLDWDGTRRLWLRRHFGATPDQVTITSRKDLVRGIALIDDKPRHVKEWYDRNPAGLAILYAQPYNRGTLRDDFTDRMNWSDIPDSFKTFRMLLEQRREEEHLKWRQYRRIQP